MNIAKRNAFTGIPIINTPRVLGQTTGQHFLYRIPVTGERPISVSVEGLPSGLSCVGGILSGSVGYDCHVVVTIIAENACGRTEKELELIIAPDTVQLTPLMGFTTWNAFRTEFNQEKILETAQSLISSGIADYGYGYVNIDSGWQDTYGGEYNAIIPNHRFPDMKEMCDTLHALGFRAGIYSTPMLKAWGCPPELSFIPGCTVGDPDPAFPDTENGGIGLVHLEKENVRQWCDWGFDYLKYDWNPTDGHNAHLMKKELLESKRTFTYCNTVHARLEDAETFAKEVNSWRDNVDSSPDWDNIKARLATVFRWGDYVSPGHFYDLDMLAIGSCHEDTNEKPMTHNEEIFAYTLRAFFCSPIQLSTKIEKLTDFELDMLCNEEIIAINQDALADYPKCVSGTVDDDYVIFKRNLENGDVAVCVFTLDCDATEISLPLKATYHIRDVWQKRDLATSDSIEIKAEPHSAYVFRLKKA